MTLTLVVTWTAVAGTVALLSWHWEPTWGLTHEELVLDHQAASSAPEFPSSPCPRGIPTPQAIFSYPEQKMHHVYWDILKYSFYFLVHTLRTHK